MALLNQVPERMRARVMEMALEITSVTRRYIFRGRYEVIVEGINKNGNAFCIIGLD